MSKPNDSRQRKRKDLRTRKYRFKLSQQQELDENKESKEKRIWKDTDKKKGGDYRPLNNRNAYKSFLWGYPTWVMSAQITNTKNFLVGERIINKFLNHMIKKENSWYNWFDEFRDIFTIRILYIRRTLLFLSRTRRKLLIRFSGGVIYIYPNEPFIESLQLMFDLEEKEKLSGKWVFMIR